MTALDSGLIALVLLLGILAWLYERTWNRQYIRMQHYLAVLERLPASADICLDKAAHAALEKDIRKLWLTAPDSVVRAANTLLDSIENPECSCDERTEALSNLVLAMRGDATFLATLFPGFRSTDLHAGGVAINLVRRPAR